MSEKSFWALIPYLSERNITVNYTIQNAKEKLTILRRLHSLPRSANLDLQKILDMELCVPRVKKYLEKTI